MAFAFLKNNATFAAVNLLQKMGCVKLHILNEQYKSTELKISYRNNNLTLIFCDENARRVTGYSYVHNRYLNRELGIWLSVDPLAHKYPHQNPYMYCSGNQIGRIDPDGREDGNFHDWNGKYLGNDGNTDNKVHLVSDKRSEKTIKANEKAGNSTNPESVRTDVTTTREVLTESIGVYNRTIANGGFSEESSVVSPDGRNIARGQTGPDQSAGGTATVTLPSMLGNNNTSIHSHPTGETATGRIWVPEQLGGLDAGAFRNYDLNIVVGKFQVSPNTIGNYRESGAVFYNRNSNQIGSMTLGGIRKILNR